MQNDLDRLMGWTDELKREFYINNCNVMHFSCINTDFSYCLEGEWLENLTEHNDLRIIVDDKGKIFNQALYAQNKGNKKISNINKNV